MDKSLRHSAPESKPGAQADKPPAATEESFAEILPVWNACPPDWPPEYRQTMLMWQNLPILRRVLKEEESRIVKLPPGKLPLPSPKSFWAVHRRAFGDAHDAALRELGWWHLFTGMDARRVLGGWRGNVRDWLAFRDYSLAASHPHELAVYRTLLEMDYDLYSDGKHLPSWLEQLEATEHPAEDGRKEQLREQRRNELARSVGGWLKRLQGETPTLKRIRETKERVAAYEAARDAARQTLEKSVFPASLKTQALVPSYVRREVGPATSAEEWALPKRMVIPHHLFVAQCHARGCIAEDSLANFFNANHGAFWRLTNEGRQEFLDTYHKGKKPAGHKFDVLAAWIEDNIPVFLKYGWDWAGIAEEAKARSLPIPKDEMSKWASDRAKGWHLDSGNLKTMKQTVHLLTPRPSIATFKNSET